MQGLMQDMVPLSSERHKDASISRDAGFSFSNKMTHVPVLLSELQSLSRDYATGFLQADDKIALVAVLGLQAEENLYVDQKGSWAVSYIPAMLRQYPFAALVDNQSEKSKAVLCVASGFEGLNNEGRGQPLFDAEGKPTKLTMSAREFVSQTSADAQRTESFARMLRDRDLLVPLKAILQGPEGETRGLEGLYVASKKAVDALSAEDLKTMQQSGALAAIHTHLASIANLQALANRIRKSEASVFDA
ncbi:SapC family protein [Yoonia litorea]|uniref:SapC protein n=1 Tax=Yoonia litorea TaxID=1123755 RepID=A0A1I6LNT6_9RHOB|nr:SapC family protein [Yoonia litorea]SFS05156.1 SapC protein [Yoonia litorea]